MPDKDGHKEGESPKPGWFQRLGLLAPDPEEGGSEAAAVPTPGQKPVGAAVPISSSFVAGVAIDQAKFNSVVATLTANYPGLVILDQV